MMAESTRSTATSFTLKIQAYLPQTGLKIRPSFDQIIQPPLQARMIEDMTARGLQAKTQVAHIRSCRRFAKWLGRSPDMASPEPETWTGNGTD